MILIDSTGNLSVNATNYPLPMNNKPQIITIELQSFLKLNEILSDYKYFSTFAKKL